jgi:membrane protease YdiL (CAAX protease family)
MNRIESYKGALGKQHPIMHVLVGASLATVGLIITGIIGVLILKLLDNSIESMVLLQISSQIVVFILPALCLSYLVDKNMFSYFDTFDKKNIVKYLIGIVAVISAAYFIQIMVIDKATFVFPESLKFFESIAKLAQNEYDKFIAQLLTITNPIMLSIVFVMVAVMPAIGEELLFRGVLQKGFEQAFKNKWMAIFISGTIFGIIHFEFYNFFALCFMGFVLGYIYAITKNIYITMLLHFINNGTAIVSMYLYKKNMISMNPEDIVPMYVMLIAGVVLVISLVGLWKYSEQKEIANAPIS